MVASSSSALPPPPQFKPARRIASAGTRQCCRLQHLTTEGWCSSGATSWAESAGLGGRRSRSARNARGGSSASSRCPARSPQRRWRSSAMQAVIAKQSSYEGSARLDSGHAFVGSAAAAEAVHHGAQGATPSAGRLRPRLPAARRGRAGVKAPGVTPNGRTSSGSWSSASEGRQWWSTWSRSATCRSFRPLKSSRPFCPKKLLAGLRFPLGGGRRASRLAAA